MLVSLKRLIWRRAAHACEYCGMPQAIDELPFQIDHIVARQHGGPTTIENLALACFACNNHKGPNVAAVDPRTGRIVPLFHPRHQRWARHFRYDGALLVGRTAVGRATALLLGMNAPHRVSLREALIEEGAFPAASPRSTARRRRA